MNAAWLLDEQGKENVDLVNRMRNYKDPLLEEFDNELEKEEPEEESGDSDDESSSGSESDEVDIKFPRDDAQDLLQFIGRDLKNIQNMEDGQKRKFSLIRLY